MSEKKTSLHSIILQLAFLFLWQLRATQTEVFVAAACKGMVHERLKLVGLLHEAGIKTEGSYKNNPKILNQLQVRH